MPEIEMPGLMKKPAVAGFFANGKEDYFFIGQVLMPSSV